MTIVLARELQRLGVRANAIAPVARTRLTTTDPLMAPHFEQKPEDAFDRLAPENVAPVVAWLASSRSEPITGQVVKVQGGLIQLFQGCRPITTATAEKPWTIDDVDAARDALLGGNDPGVPPFFA